ncbi:MULTISPECIES: pyridoxamine kinase [Terrabacteria group]|uniref:pyridoxamine kinase n=1 Tax=Bacillati TaxID=1783272 RepID=UPI001C6EDD2B|nr:MULTISPECIES: pyridoxamine kinase [Terrabacteria group]MBW9212686.1 pyridoxamine kinase [Trueperella sp. zg.1013]MBW9213177.1 pyridoxamine kinase [Trueperella sp. zg.1013]
MKKIITMQDVSCVGKCSLTVALPILSAIGIETAVIPTAVLSTHTMFSEFTFHDLTREVEPILAHWQKEGFSFNGVYTGYLGSFAQIELAQNLFNQFGKNALKVVDPCMADNGELYPGFDVPFAHKMGELCAVADIIVPNLTEASFLLDIPYQEKYDEAYIQDVLRKLTDLGCPTAILTGIQFEHGSIGAYAYEKDSDTFTSYFNQEEPRHFHGTGDIWASTFSGGLIQGLSLLKAMTLACDYVKESIHKTLEEENYNTYGVNFEQAMPFLIKSLDNYNKG